MSTVDLERRVVEHLAAAERARPKCQARPCAAATRDRARRRAQARFDHLGLPRLGRGCPR